MHKAKKHPVRSQNHNKTTTTILVAKKNELPLSQTKTIKPESLDIIMERAQKTLQDTFDETRETCLEQNPWMKIAEAEKKAFGELKSNYRQASTSQYHNLVQMGNIFKKKSQPKSK